jgi:hypothetical protein
LSKAGSGKGAQLGPSTAAWLLSVGVEPSELLNGEPAAVRIFDRAASRAARCDPRHIRPTGLW